MKILNNNTFDKLKNLEDYIYSICKNDICIAFSGGVDSSLLLDIVYNQALKNDINVYAITFSTKLHPKCDIDFAKNFCRNLHIKHIILEIDEFENEKILSNPINRCYICKKYIFQKLINFAEDNNIKVCLEGTNFDDLNYYRPGIKALNELNIISPLMNFKLTKNEIRDIAEFRGLSVSNKPSSPCLATRLPYNTKIDFKLFNIIEKGENFLKDLGFYNVRIRVHNEIARIEIDKKDFNKFIENSNLIIESLKRIGFIYITLDIEGFRSGSMDININN